MAQLPFKVERVQTDNESEFGASFHRHLLDAGVDHVKIKPRTTRLNGKVERSHRIDSEEFYRLLEGQVMDDTNLFVNRLQEWEDYCNYHRPHGALNGQTPYERLRQRPKTLCHRPFVSCTQLCRGTSHLRMRNVVSRDIVAFDLGLG
jgi:transposase InsO family protein